jgi:AraC-like DNA-binding protein
MHYQQYSPQESLKDLVQFFWSFEAELNEYTSYSHRVTASIHPKLAFQYEGQMQIQDNNPTTEEFFRSGFQGQGNQSYQISAQQKVGIFGVSFFPQAIPLLFSLPAAVMTNQQVEIVDALGVSGKELEEKMLSAHSNVERVNIITLFLEKQLTKSATPDSKLLTLITHIITRQGLVNITPLVTEQCVSQRQLERKFKALTGFSPKTFSRIVRFEHSLSTYLHTHVPLTQLAYACGYYDQSHFIRDFREFAGQHPKAYFRQDLSWFTP